MIKLLIADDEPLVCIGIKSMLKWENYNIEVIDTARNGLIAKEIIDTYKPDIVISDIKMPIKTGLELIAECSAEYGRVPLFIMLTSYEEFQYVKEALKYQAVEYLIKPELTVQSLTDAVVKALNILREYNKINPTEQSSKPTLQTMREKFFLRLYNNLFESETQFNAQKEDLEINFSGKNYVVLSAKIENDQNSDLSTEKLFSLCTSTAEALREILHKEYKTFISIMDIRRFNITIEINDDVTAEMDNLKTLITRGISLVFSYFNVNLLISVGSPVKDPYFLSDSYLIAQKLLRFADESNNIVIAKDTEKSETKGFVFSDIKPELRKAFEEIDANALNTVFDEIIDFYTINPALFIEALDTSTNILYMTISLLPDGEKNISSIFANEPDSYRCIYSYTTTSEVVTWLKKLSDGIVSFLSTKKKDYKEQVVQNVKDYINDNLDKKLSLNEVAYVFNFNPNYLSHLFAKYSDSTFVEFITKSKIDSSKKLLLNGELRINEVAEKLGFDNAFYFSKVFKKYVGMSPREFQQKSLGGTKIDY